MNDNQMINVPRNEVERLVKLLQHQAHPYPSPHAEFWQGQLDKPALVAVAPHERSPKDYAIEHAEYMATSADHVLAEFQAYGLALLAVDEGGDDGEGELFENVDAARSDLQESLVGLRHMVYEFRKRRDRIPRRTGETAQ